MKVDFPAGKNLVLWEYQEDMGLKRPTVRLEIDHKLKVLGSNRSRIREVSRTGRKNGRSRPVITASRLGSTWPFFWERRIFQRPWPTSPQALPITRSRKVGAKSGKQTKSSTTCFPLRPVRQWQILRVPKSYKLHFPCGNRGPWSPLR